MSKLYSSHKRFIGLGLMSALVIALAVLGTLWGFGQMASANTDVTLKHLNPDGSVYVGNSYCPQTVWSADGKTATPDPRHDCNNIAGQKHVIRTDTTGLTTPAGVFSIDGVGTILSQGLCNDLPEIADKLAWCDDDGDGVCDEDGDNEGVDDDDDGTEDGVGAIPDAGNCDDGLDNDADTLIDGDDPQCAAFIDEDQTADGTDDDDDGTEDGVGAVPGAGDCDNDLDDDDNGTDMNDADCVAFDGEDPGGDDNLDGCPGVCGVDDDGDTLIDEDCGGLLPANPAYANDCDDDDDEDGTNDEDLTTDGVDDDDDGMEDGSGPNPGSGDCDNDLDDDDNDTDMNDPECAAFDGEDPIDFDDDGDCVGDPPTPPATACGTSGGIDEDPPGSVDLDLSDEYCVVIRSIAPGETSVIFTYGGVSTDAIHKEWDKLEDTVILKKDDVDKKVTVVGIGKVELPLDANGNDIRDADDAHILDHNGETQDHAVMWDEALKRHMSAEGPIRLIEVVHGYHAEMPDHPTEGAVVLAFIDSTRGCSYFTNPTPVIVGGIAYQAGDLNLGTAVVGISDWRGFSIGPKFWPAGAQFSAEALAEAAAHLLEPPMSNNSGVAGVALLFEADYAGVYVDTACEEQATISFKVGYPDYVQSVPEIPEIEQVTINWTTVEAAKQPQIRWAGEEILLEKRWAPPGEWVPEVGGIDDDLDGKMNEDCNDWAAVPPNLCTQDDDDNDGLVDEDGITGEFSGVDLDGDTIPGDAMATGVDDDGDMADYNEDGTDAATPGTGDCVDGIDNDGDTPPKIDGADPQCAVWIDEDVADDDGDCVGTRPTPPATACSISGGINEDPLDICPLAGSLVEYIKLGGPGGLVEGPDSVWTTIDDNCVSRTLYSSEDQGQVDVEAVLYDPETEQEIDNKHAFLVWYLKVYQVKLTNVDGLREDHNAGVWTSGEGEDTVETTLNVSQDTLLRVTVKGWFEGGNNSGRGAVCVDIDGDGNGLEGDLATEPGEPYSLLFYEDGCDDPDDEILDHGYWVLPDDMATLAGPHPDRIPSWDVMSEPTVAAKSIIGPKSTLDSHDATTRQVVPCILAVGQNTCTRKTIDPDGAITEADALMPPLKVLVELEAEDAGFLKTAAKSADVGIDSAYQSVMIPANAEIPPFVNNGHYDWDSWGWTVLQYAYPFFVDLTKTTEPEQGLIRGFEFYTDNRGEGYFFANGDYNLTYDDCRTSPLGGAPDCSQGDVVGETTMTVIGDYPYFRKHSAVESNEVTKTWTWGGFKSVTAEAVDPNHTLVIAHVVDRDGYCKNEVDVDEDPMEVQFSPSLNPVEGEEITFEIVNSIGHILSADLDGISPNAKFNVVPSPLAETTVSGWEDGVLINAEKAIAKAEHEELLKAIDQGASVVEEDECQAWVLIQHPLGAELELSVVFDDPEGRITRHWPPTELLVNLVTGWNDSCYVDDEATVEEAMAAFIDDVLAVYLYDATDTEDTWKAWFPGNADLSDLDILLPYDQLFILMGASATWEQLITALPASVDLVGASAENEMAGAWNSVCYAGIDKLAEEATSNISSAFVVMYTLGSDQAWRRYVPDRPEIPDTLTTLHMFDSVILLVTAEGSITWVFD